MLAGTTASIPVDPGEHSLQGEFVAVDHGPFDPRVRTTVPFDVVAPTDGG